MSIITLDLSTWKTPLLGRVRPGSLLVHLPGGTHVGLKEKAKIKYWAQGISKLYYTVTSSLGATNHGMSSCPHSQDSSLNPSWVHDTLQQSRGSPRDGLGPGSCPILGSLGWLGEVPWDSEAMLAARECRAGLRSLGSLGASSSQAPSMALSNLSPPVLHHLTPPVLLLCPCPCQAASHEWTGPVLVLCHSSWRSVSSLSLLEKTLELG